MFIFFLKIFFWILINKICSLKSYLPNKTNYLPNIESRKSVGNWRRSRDLIEKNMKVEKNDFKVFNVIYGVLPAVEILPALYNFTMYNKIVQ